MGNLITQATTKEEIRENYRNYPDTAPEGFAPFHASRVDPIYWDIPDNVSVLDIGCNSGEFMRRLLNGRKNVTAKGIDISENAVRIAQEKGLDVVLGDGQELPFQDASFDYVVLMEVLVHVLEPKKLISEIRRVLKPSGVLIGSCPHKNLEMNIWDDARLHHAYYTTDELYDFLKETFPNVHFKVLKGGQFAIAMADTMMRDQEVEILFKCGSDDMADWDWQLKKTDVLRAWMGPTQNPGTAFYRMVGFADKMNKLDRTDVLYHGFSYEDEEGPGNWQNALERSEGNRPANKIVVDQLDGMLKIADLSIWQITPSWGVLAFLQCLKELRKKPILLEMDDWLFDMPAYNIASNPYRPNSERERIAYQQIELSDAVICSTRFIEEQLRQIFPEKPIYVVPNAIDFDIWDAVKAQPVVAKEASRIRVGYTGCGNHGRDLEMIAEPIKALLDEFPNVEFLTYGPMLRGREDKYFMIRHDRSYVLNRWSTVKDWPAAVKGWQIDIGIAPLLDLNFNRAKSNLRWLEYSALNVPTVASDVRPFRESIRNASDGFLCLSKREWYDALRTLILNEERRREIGQNAYDRVKRDFNLNDVAKKYRSILEVVKRESRTTRS